MIQSTESRPFRTHHLGDLMVVEMPTMAHGRTWAMQPEDDYILVDANLPERERRLALAEALEALVAAQDNPAA